MEINYYGNNDWRDCCLAHFGIRGMHWGIRRFQPYSTTGPRKGGKTGKEVGLAKRVGNKISEGVKGIRTAHKRKIAAKKRAASLEKARKVKAEKEEIMKSGDAEKLLARKELFSNDDIDKFLERAGKETKVAELRQKQIDAGFQKADQIQEKVKKIAGYIGTANDLVSQGVKLKGNIDDAAKALGFEKKKGKETDRIVNSGSAEEVLNAIRNGKLDANQVQTAKNRLDNQANIENRILDEGKKAAEEAANRLVNSGSAEEVLRGSREGSLNADQTQKALNRLNNQKNIEGMINRDPTDIEKAINSADAKAISNLWSSMSSSEKKEAFDSVTRKATIEKSIPKEDSKKEDSKKDDSQNKSESSVSSSSTKTFNNKWTNLGLQGANRTSPYSTQPRDKIEAILRRDYGSMLTPGNEKWSNSAGSYKTERSSGGRVGEQWGTRSRNEDSSRLSGSQYNQPRLTMNSRNDRSSSNKPRVIDAEVVNGRAIPVSGSSRTALLGPTSSSSTRRSNTGPLTLNPSAEARNYNKRATENLKAYSKKASDLTKQTNNIDFGEDLVRDLLSGRR